jgi:hypothetical protein
MSGAQGLDLFDAEHDVLASLRPGRAAVVFAGGELLQAEPAVNGEEAAGDEVTLDLDLTPVASPLVLQGEGVGAEELTVVRALGRLDSPVISSEIATLAVQSQVVEEPSPALRRSLAVVFADGGLLAIAAAAAPGSPHGAEEIVAVFAEPEGEVPIERVLLSTEYDGEGRQRRATVELWAQGESVEPPIRGAGSAIRSAAVTVGDRRIETAFFSWSLEGRSGLGRYELIGPA